MSSHPHQGPVPAIAGLPLGQLRDAADLAVTVAAAAEAGLFAGLNQAPATTAELAARLELDPRAVRATLPVLAETGLVEEREGRWALTERGARELGDPASPGYVGRGFPLWLANLRRWSRLADVLRTGEPPPREETSAGGVAEYVAGMAAAPAGRVRRTVELALARRPGARSAIDLGGGPGLYAVEFARAGVDATLLDAPEVVRHVAEAYPAGQDPRVHLAGGDFLTDPLPGGPYDVALLSNVLHLFDPPVARALLEKVHAALAPGGVVAVAETLSGRSPRAGRMALLMVLRTRSGEVYGEEEFREWLEETGFGEVRVDELEGDRQLVTAVRR